MILAAGGPGRQPTILVVEDDPRMQLLVQAVLRTEGGLRLRALSWGLVAGERLWIGVRPERMAFDGPGENRIAGVLEARQFLGDRSEWRVRACAEVLTVAEPGAGNGRRTGEVVTVTFPAAAVLRLQADPSRGEP